ncbi:putative AMP-dependent synthetase/ligase [Magnetofaba australis IT-1]|uniref:Putative AMP-dependent synthetase/ligase n=1 Tax=Magnetofaba australis IT-1 TaxID=1434232 RepID=A0A1Y2JZF4_9PROT|nr:putative AMP-dependent synthetase/ligase [Magnetofaba australis IT-1]
MARWRAGLRKLGLKQGQRVAIQLHNRREWALFDQAALSLGLITVPLYAQDRPESARHVLSDSGARALLTENVLLWREIKQSGDLPRALQHVLILQGGMGEARKDARVQAVETWLPEQGDPWPFDEPDMHADSLATITYTSGSTGPAKGVMLTHGNILADVYAAVSRIEAYPEDCFLSFLPLSHALERTAGYYLPMLAGSEVAYARSIADLPEDLRTVRPTVLISAPRIFERIHRRVMEKLSHAAPWRAKLLNLAVASGWDHFQHQQHRARWSWRETLWPLLRALAARPLLARLGGRLRVAVSGGAPLSPEISHFFLGLGLPLVQGYGLTETAPVVSVNTLEDNAPETVGAPLPGIDARTDEKGELCVRGPNVMRGYWRNPLATKQAIDAEGWYHTGDLAELDAHGHIRLVGRLKEILVMANGRKVAPGDVESAIERDPLFAQTLLIGEGRPYLALLATLDESAWRKLAQEQGLDPNQPAALADGRIEGLCIKRMNAQLAAFPAYVTIRRAHLTFEPWSVENGLITPTLKIKRHAIVERYGRQIDALYRGHEA